MTLLARASARARARFLSVAKKLPEYEARLRNYVFLEITLETRRDPRDNEEPAFNVLEAARNNDRRRRVFT